ncbi:MAG: YcgL domain-containing protein [Gammaproteobacteria bacterium]|uniref:YcgL domain-containing protein DOQ08_00846 n=1 Tax=Marinobacter litoralis TaxID=187981 RepID=A0A3M2RLQ4_9GAMM|nr:YcgL domain-containing protein [Marinobacter litoralis]MBR9871281.1 YcgL domain-containing protein [Gammaproteobacteria bacterium]RMJ06161.1 Protein YcgL [Marinobacter litoralis]
MTTREFVSVFRSTKKMDTYIYVRRGHDWQELPEALRSIFGQPAHAMDLLLTPDKKLARTTGKEVLDALEEKGFFLQMPEEQDTYIVDFKRKVEQHKK